MPNFFHYDSPSGRIAVRFIATYRGVSDYGLTRCAGDYAEARVSADAQENLSVVNPETFLRDYHFPLDEALAVLREHLRAMFDRDVREIVRLNLLEHCDDLRVAVRARELKLIP